MPNRCWTAAPRCVTVLLLITLLGCMSDRAAAPSKQDVEHKLDAPLRLALRGNSDATVQVFIELEEQLDDDTRADLEAAALESISGSGRIVNASGSPEAIRRAAALDFVRSISLSQERPPLN